MCVQDSDDGSEPELDWLGGRKLHTGSAWHTHPTAPAAVGSGSAVRQPHVAAAGASASSGDVEGPASQAPSPAGSGVDEVLPAACAALQTAAPSSAPAAASAEPAAEEGQPADAPLQLPVVMPAAADASLLPDAEAAAAAAPEAGGQAPVLPDSGQHVALQAGQEGGSAPLAAAAVITETVVTAAEPAQLMAARRRHPQSRRPTSSGSPPASQRTNVGAAFRRQSAPAAVPGPSGEAREADAAAVAAHPRSKAVFLPDGECEWPAPQSARSLLNLPALVTQRWGISVGESPATLVLPGGRRYQRQLHLSSGGRPSVTYWGDLAADLQLQPGDFIRMRAECWAPNRLRQPLVLHVRLRPDTPVGSAAAAAGSWPSGAGDAADEPGGSAAAEAADGGAEPVASTGQPQEAAAPPADELPPQCVGSDGDTQPSADETLPNWGASWGRSPSRAGGRGGKRRRQTGAAPGSRKQPQRRSQAISAAAAPPSKRQRRAQVCCSWL